MNNFKQYVVESENNNLHEQMKDWLVKRTRNHIHLVQKYAKKIEDYDPKRFQGLVNIAQKHDQSKFHEPEFSPYQHIAWQYHMKDLGKEYDPPADTKDKMNAATEHHIKRNSHHPEYWTNETSNLINRENRDKPPEKMINASKMPDVAIAEMVSDWLAISEEKSTDPIEWADKNVNVRWKFTPEQTKLIYTLIKDIYKK